jgi:hypothetical protein
MIFALLNNCTLINSFIFVVFFSTFDFALQLTTFVAGVEQTIHKHPNAVVAMQGLVMPIMIDCPKKIVAAVRSARAHETETHPKSALVRMCICQSWSQNDAGHISEYELNRVRIHAAYCRGRVVCVVGFVESLVDSRPMQHFMRRVKPNVDYDSVDQEVFETF